MQKQTQFFITHAYTICIAFLLLVAAILRFYNYSERFGLAYDQAHDAIIAEYAIDTFKLPLLGPFSSAGPYQTGGEWYWIIMIGTLFSSFSLLAPWIFMTLLYVGFVACILFVSKYLINKEYALIVGALAVVSTAQINQGTNLTNQSPQALLSLLSIWFAIHWIRTKTLRSLFLLALTIGTAASIHLQGVAMILLLFFTIIFSGIPRISEIGVMVAGLGIPWIPVLFVDIQHNFFNTKNMLQYYLHDQYKISLDVLGRRWLTYAGIFIPKSWSHIIGGYGITGYMVLLSLGAIVFGKIIKRNLSKEWWVLLLSFSGMLGILRYTRTPLFESYLVFLHPFIFLFTGWVIYKCYTKQRVLGLLLLGVVVFGSMQKSIHDIRQATNKTASIVSAMKKELLLKFPRQQFTVYDFSLQTKDKSVPLVLFLEHDRKNAEHAMQIGFITETYRNKYIRQTVHYPIIGGKEGYLLLDLRNASEKELTKNAWGKVSPEEIYRSTQEWYK